MKLHDLKLTTPYRELSDIFYHDVKPSALDNPHYISHSDNAAALIDLDVDDLDKLVDIVNGQDALTNDKSFAMAYAGHQFGHFVPRLGDGRAINLGKIKGWNLQLKGAGQTLYSRQGDGRAVLRSSIREYLMSEAMHHLGIPTSRALAIIGSNHKVARERWESGSIVLRMSPSWIRFGSFEYFYYKEDHDKLKELMDFVIDESYPHLKTQEDAYFLMYEELVHSTAKLMAQWQSVGFNHGVMNTDNMSIEGLTIDYGPYAFLDDYDFNFICNHTDVEGRYSFGSQPSIGYWNVAMLARSLSPLINFERLQSAYEKFGEIYAQESSKILHAKLGLEEEQKGDTELIKWLFGILQQAQVDHTLFFRTLSNYDGDHSALRTICVNPTDVSEWLDTYDIRLEREKSNTQHRQEKMLKTNPKYILKNHLLQCAIDEAEKGNFDEVNTLLVLAQTPYDEHENYEEYAKSTPEHFKNIKLSCSS